MQAAITALLEIQRVKRYIGEKGQVFTVPLVT